MPFVLGFWASCTGVDAFSTDSVELGEQLGEWGNPDLGCADSTDCLTNEVCVQGSCQVDRCAANLAPSEPPIGQVLTFLDDAEFAVADASPFEGLYWATELSPEPSVVDYFEAVDTPIVDLAGGSFGVYREDLYAFLHDNGWTISLPGLALDLFLDGPAIALAAGDLDGDGTDELVAVDEADRVWACEIEEGCAPFTIDDDLDQVDVAIADIDGDNVEEPILLLVDESDNTSWLFSFDLHDASIGQDGTHFGAFDDAQVTRIAAGDGDGDYRAEVVGVRDACLFDFLCNDELLLAVPDADRSGAGTFRLAYRSTVDDESLIDVAAADTDGDDRMEVYALSGNANTVLVQQVGTTAFIPVDRYAELPGTGEATRITMADHDGDAPRGTLVDGPMAVQGDLVPLATIVVPPYDRQYSDGEASIAFGTSEGQNQGESEGNSFGVNFSIGAKGSLVPGLVSVKAGGKFAHKTSTTRNFRESYKVSSRHSLNGNPDDLGPNHAGVILAWGCYDAYLYEIDDPEGKLSDGENRLEGDRIILNVPTGGGEALYSAARYNAMARELGTFPVIEVPYEVGNPDAYPSTPETLTGYPLGPADVVFPDPGVYEVSDIGRASFALSYSETESTSTTVSRSVGVNGGVSVGTSVFGIEIGAGADWGWTDGYSIGVSQGAYFRGGTPPIPDRLGTPEDEFATYRFRYQPWVYTEEWVNPFGETASFIVVTYSVER